MYSVTEFQSTLPRGERLSPASILLRIFVFQSTLPRGERQYNFTRKGNIYGISIHAPARGATFCRCFLQLFSSISIHAPARGATIPLLFLFFPSMHFNPRSREGSDLALSGRYIIMRDISIHAPARGATSILSKIHPMFLTISHNASSFSSFPFHSFLPHLLNSSTFCALFQVRISRAFSVYYRFAPKKSTPDL